MPRLNLGILLRGAELHGSARLQSGAELPSCSGPPPLSQHKRHFGLFPKKTLRKSPCDAGTVLMMASGNLGSLTQPQALPLTEQLCCLLAPEWPPGLLDVKEEMVFK